MLPIRPILCSVLLLSLGGGVSALAQSAAPTAATTRVSRLNVPYRILGADSVALFYNADYELCPPGCAAIRRHARLDSTGQFFGAVQDFWMQTAQPALTGAYRNGQKEGVFELFYPSGEACLRGYYRQGKPVGNWTYWYPSGQQRQVLSYGDGSQMLIQQFWTPEGQQQVRDGAGSWYREEEGFRISGSVEGGLPQGRWVVSTTGPKPQPRLEEQFKQGKMQWGRSLPAAQYNSFYYGISRIYLTDLDAYTEAERFTANLACPPSSGAPGR